MTEEKHTLSLANIILPIMNIAVSITLVIKMIVIFGTLFGIISFVVLEAVMSIVMIYKHKDLIMSCTNMVPDEEVARKIIEQELPVETATKTILMALLFYGSRII